MPAQERLILHIPLKKLLIGLVLTVCPICILGLYSLSQSHRSLQRTVGNQFKTMADNVAAATSQFINDRVIQVGAIAALPEIAEAAAAGNHSHEGQSDEALKAKFDRIEKIWNTPAGEALVNQILSNKASRLLRRQRELDPRLLRITVTDAKGAVVAASHKTLDYYQADEEYWTNIYAQGRGAVSVTDILFDEATHSNYIGIGVPVMEEGTSRLIGTLDALVDVTSLFPVIQRLQLGGSGRTLLVKDDGTVISGPQSNLAMKLKADEFLAVKDALGTLQGRQTGYVVADLPARGGTVIGFSDVGLKADYEKLNWVVLVCQDAREAFAPIRVIDRLLALMSVIGLLGVGFLAIYFSLHRTRPMTEIGDLRRAAQATGE